MTQNTIRRVAALVRESGLAFELVGMALVIEESAPDTWDAAEAYAQSGVEYIHSEIKRIAPTLAVTRDDYPDGDGYYLSMRVVGPEIRAVKGALHELDLACAIANESEDWYALEERVRPGDDPDQPTRYTLVMPTRAKVVAA